MAAVFSGKTTGLLAATVLNVFPFDPFQNILILTTRVYVWCGNTAEAKVAFF